MKTEEQREVARRYEKELFQDCFLYNPLSVLFRVLEVTEDPPERVWFPFIPGNSRMWYNNDTTEFALRPRKSRGKYCMDLYKGENVAHREVGGKFMFWKKAKFFIYYSPFLV